MATTEAEALEEMRAHHRVLDDEVASLALAVRRASAAGAPVGAPVGALAAYVAGHVLPHALAEEATVYRAAVEVGLAGTIEEMTAEHRRLEAAVDELAGAAGEEAARRAEAIAGLFTAHVAKENELVLPRLVDDPRVDLAGLLAGMHRALHGAAAAPPARPGPADLELDVREMAPATRHGAIFAAFDALAPGGGLVLVNDHDPKPLRYQFEAEHPGTFAWTYLEDGPRRWRVRIERTP